jgi:hypothetical protein
MATLSIEQEAAMIKQRETKTIAIPVELFKQLEGATADIKPSALLAHLGRQWLSGNMAVKPIENPAK